MFAGRVSVLVHGCNAMGAFNAGIARQVRKLHPEAYMAYRDAPEQDRRLGNVIWSINASKRLIIGNAVTQQHYGRDGKVYVDYQAIGLAMETIAAFVRHWHCHCHVPGIDVATVGFPRIGSGLGGGDWAIISQIIEIESTNFQPVVFDGKSA